MWRSLDQLLRSPRLAIGLILFIAFAAVWGTFPDSYFTRAEQGDPIARTLLLVGADRLFATRWFQSSLAVLGLLMAYASVRRIPVVLRALAYLPAATLWQEESGVVSSMEVAVGADARETAQVRLLHLLHERGYRSRQVETDAGATTILMDKGRLGALGSPLIHFGMVVVLCGGFITHAFGHRDDILLGEGESYQLPGTESAIRLGKFSIVHHPNRREPEEYVSTLIVFDGAGERGWHLLRVNQPLSVAGHTLYQMEYRPDVRAAVLDVVDPETGRVRASLEVPPDGSRVATGVDGHVVAVMQVASDFAVGPDGQAFNRSDFFVNPAVRIAVYRSMDAPAPMETAWVMRDLPQSHGRVRVGPGFRLRRLRMHYFSGITVVRDPGMVVAYLGFLLLVVGAFISSYVYQRFVRLEFPRAIDAEECQVRIAGFTRRHQPEFALEWRSLVTQFRRAAGSG